MLNSEDYSRRELEAIMENIKQPSWRYSMDDWPEDWVGQLYSYFAEHNPRATANRDDQGGYPSDDELNSAIRGMGWSEDLKFPRNSGRSKKSVNYSEEEQHEQAAVEFKI